MNQRAFDDLTNGWDTRWTDLGVKVIGWGWLEGDPVAEARLAVNLCRSFELYGYIANAEVYYEGAGKAKSKAFVDEFRRLAPRAPLGLSYIGYGYPYRDLDWGPWITGDAWFLPQCYTANDGHSVDLSLDAAWRAGLPFDRIAPTVATSAMQSYYSPVASRAELERAGIFPACSVWLLESTNDDTLRALLG